MRTRFVGVLCVVAVVVAVVSLAPVPVAEASGEGAQSATAPADPWTPPRTADGQPDLQGVWANNSATPLERPKELAGKQVLSDEELADLKQRAARALEGDGDAIFGDGLVRAALANVKAKSYDPTTGNYNHFWLVERDFDHRTSLVIDPADGRIPPLTPEAQERARARREYRRDHPADSWEDRSLGERCLTFGVPRLGAGYNSYFQIVQTPGHVAILQEMAHDVRLIPLDGRPHLAPSLRQWMGDSRGHWEGNTLVVDTTNFSPKSNFRGSAQNLHVVERFTRVGPDTINYEVTIDDPTTWTSAWTLMIPLKKTEDAIFEYACHEGNYSMEGILAGHRAQEKAATEAAKKKQ